jgi:hypothetical protein
MFNKYLAIAVTCISLAGCKGEFGGSYAGENGMGTYAVMTVDGNSAKVESIGRLLRNVRSVDNFEADVREGKLVLSNRYGTFNYGLAVDEESLDWLSQSCQGFAGLGAAGVPRT